RPVAAQPDLDEVTAGDRATFDQTAHRSAMAGQVGVEDVGGGRGGGGGDHSDVAVAVHIGDSGRCRPRDGVVATHRERDDPSAGHLAHAGFYILETCVHPGVRGGAI